MPGVGGGARGSVLRVLSRLGVTQIGPSTSGGLPGRSLAPFGLWPPPIPRAPPRMTLLGAIWSCRRAQMGSMLPLEQGWVLGTSHGRGVPRKTPWSCQMLRYRRGLDGIRPASCGSGGHGVGGGDGPSMGCCGGPVRPSASDPTAGAPPTANSAHTALSPAQHQGRLH